jgi:hypothetical protein
MPKWGVEVVDVFSCQAFCACTRGPIRWRSSNHHPAPWPAPAPGCAAEDSPLCRVRRRDCCNPSPKNRSIMAFHHPAQAVGQARAKGTGFIPCGGQSSLVVIAQGNAQAVLVAVTPPPHLDRSASALQSFSRSAIPPSAFLFRSA